MFFSLFLFFSYFHLTSFNVVDFKETRYSKNNGCRNKILISDFAYSIISPGSRLSCAFKCSNDDNCLSFHFERYSLVCQLNTKSSTENCVNMTTNTDADHFDKVGIEPTRSSGRGWWW